MRRTHRKDANQDDIVAALRAIGCTVYIIGRPVDLLVGRAARNWLFDVKKAGSTVKSLTPFQKEFFASWKGQVRTVETPEEAIKVVTESYK